MLTAWFIGDSMFFPGADESASIPAAFLNACQAGGSGCRVIGVTAPGLGSVAAIRYFRRKMEAKIGRNDLVVVSLGLNEEDGADREQKVRSPRTGNPRWPWPTRGSTVDVIFQQNLELLCAKATRRGARVVLIRPKCARWLPPNGPLGKFLFCSPGFGIRALDPVDCGSPAEALFHEAADAALRGSLSSCEFILRRVLAVEGIDAPLRLAAFANLAALDLDRGRLADGAATLRVALKEIGRESCLLKLLAYCERERGEASEELLDAAANLDGGLPRLTSRIDAVLVRVAERTGATLWDLAELSDDSVLDHCHLTKAAAESVGAAIAELLPTRGAKEERPGWPGLSWRYPNPNSECSTNGMEATFGMAGSHVPIASVHPAMLELLLAHPGILDQHELPDRAYVHEVTRYPELLWEYMFGALVPSLPVVANPLRWALTKPDERLCAEIDAMREPYTWRAADLGAAATIVLRLVSLMRDQRAVGSVYSERLLTLRRWYFREALLFGGASAWHQYVDRIAWRVTAQALLRVHAIGLQCSAVDICESVDKVFASLAMLSDIHRENLVPIVSSWIHQGRRDIVRIEEYRRDAEACNDSILAALVLLSRQFTVGHHIEMCSDAASPSYRHVERVIRVCRGQVDRVSEKATRIVRISDEMYPIA